MANLIDMSLTHRGYMAGLLGENPDKELERFEEYEDGYLVGCEDKKAGLKDIFQEAPEGLKKGSKVKILKGSKVKTTYHGERLVGRTYTVTIHDVYQVTPAYREYGGREFIRPVPAKVIWPGTGGYWSEAAVSDIEVLP